MKILTTKAEIEDLDKGIVKIRVSSFIGKDAAGDIMDEKAFNQSISIFNSSKRSRIKHLHDHDTNKLLGLPLEITKTPEGLEIISKMNIDKQSVRDVYSDYKFMAENGDTLEHSIGYIPVKRVRSNDDDANILKEVDLKEYSTLSFLGAHGNTPLLDIKSLVVGEFTKENFMLLEQKIAELESQLVKPLEQSIDTQAEQQEIEVKQNPNILLLF